MKNLGRLFLIILLLTGIAFLGSCKKQQSKLETKKVSTNNEAKSGIKFYTNLDEAKKAAKVANKPIMVDLYTDWCHWCKVLDEKTYVDPKVKKFVEEHLIPLKIQSDKEPYLAKKFHITGYPTIIFMDSNENEIDRLVGYYPPEQFLKALKEMFVEGKTFKNVKTKWETEHNFKMGKEYLNKLTQRENNKEVFKVAMDLYKINKNDTTVNIILYDSLYNGALWKKHEKLYNKLSNFIAKHLNEYKNAELYYYQTRADYYQKKGLYKKALSIIDNKILNNAKVKNNNRALTQYNFYKFNIYMLMGNRKELLKMINANEINSKYLPQNFKTWLNKVKNPKIIAGFGKLMQVFDDFLMQLQTVLRNGKDITTNSKDINIPLDPNTHKKLIYKAENAPNGKLQSLEIKVPKPSFYKAKNIYWNLQNRRITIEL